MRAFVAGGSGQLGSALLATAPTGTAITAPPRLEVSITDRLAVADAIATAKPELVINAAGYTRVDDAETDREAAFAVNGDGARNLAEAAAAVNARMIHVSTDFVFDGRAGVAYLPGDEPKPLSVYGRSKLDGEKAVLDTLQNRSLVVRTSWMYSSRGSNFVTKMLRLLGEREEVAVVMDQIGSPTAARNLARAIWTWSSLPSASGIRHFCDAGVASRYDLAIAVGEIALQSGLIESSATVLPIRTEDLAAATPRPPFSALDSFASWSELELEPVHWRQSLARTLSSASESANA
ncbi:MAG: dTDP-4-dehydrorhamnose reductase [bacterium]|nr:dTDP-4-dehydrorhamnose reductase [bacterium]